MTTTREPSIAIIGAGMSGIAMAVALLKDGFADVTLYEKADDIGGTWRDNIYPGLACDVPSRFYQYTFMPKPDWSHLFSPGQEIFEYLSGVVDNYGLRDRIRFATAVVHAHFDDGDDRWVIDLDSGGRHRVDFLISATGVLREPMYPAIAGIEDFDGPVMHSARWDSSVETAGKRVAVIGTGSTGVQIVCGLAPTASRVELFQRSAQWILPLPNLSYSSVTKFLHRRFPRLDTVGYLGYRAVFEWMGKALVEPGWRRKVIQLACRLNLRTVADRDLRDRLTPDYQPMCRRLVISSGFYRAMQRPHVELVTTTIDHIEPRGVVTSDGTLHELDVIVLATGFDAHAFMRPMRMTGRAGITLEDTWESGAKAHLTVALPGYPNFFMLMGPHSPVGNYSLTAIAESQAQHILGWIQRWRAGEYETVAPRPEATDAFNAEMRAAMPGTVWATGCTSWYLGSDGVPELWPWTADSHRHRLGRTPCPDDYLMTPPRATSVVETSDPHQGGQA